MRTRNGHSIWQVEATGDLARVHGVDRRGRADEVGSGGDRSRGFLGTISSNSLDGFDKVGSREMEQ
jgi:hypothetical protein